MKNILMQLVNDVAQNPKVAATVSGASITSGALSKWFDWIPADIGSFSLLAGGMLSIVLMFTHFAKWRRDREMHILKMRILEQQSNQPL